MSARGELTKRLAESAKEQGNNISDIARMCGVSRPTVYSWLRGSPARGEKLQRLAAIAEASQEDAELVKVLAG
jgi:transposase-like protein